MGNPAIKIRKSDGLSTGWGGDDIYVESNARFVEELRCNKKLDCRAELNVAGIQTHANASGAYINGHNAVVKTIDADSSQNLHSGAIYVPENALITKITVITLEAGTAAGSGNWRIKAGISAGNDTIVALTTWEAATTCAAGSGTSTDSILATALAADNAAALVAPSAGSTPVITSSAAREVHVTVHHGSANITAGKWAAMVEFIYAGGNA